MRYCIKVKDSDGLGEYVSEDGGITNDVNKILVTAANNVLDSACRYWKQTLHFNEYEVVEFDVDRIMEELKVAANQDCPDYDYLEFK